MTDRLRALLAGLGFGALVASSACTGLGVPSYGCSNDDNCEGGQVCRDGACVIECLDDRECPEDAQLCRFHRCVPPMAPPSAPTFSVDAAIDNG
jgi:hypothetical protein